MIKIENLNKYYNKGKGNEIHVINDVSLELPNTGLISFLGPSGSGKTTLLNVIGGLDKAKGNIQYDDLTMDKYSMHKIDKFRSKEIGYVFQNYNLLLEETVYSNLEIALEMIGIYDKEEQGKRIEYTLKAVGMYKYRKKRAYALSGGQQQRVSIARALVKKTKIIIADEPTGNLDSENTIEVMNILKKISQQSLVLVVTHNEEVANFYSDQVIRIQDGAIEDCYKNDGQQFLNTEQSNTIYLKDLNLQEEQGDFVSLKYYTSTNAKPLEIRIIEKNGTYFISSNEKIKLLEDTNLKVLDAHYQALEQKSLENFDYDTSWYQEDNKKQNIFKRLVSAFKISYNKMRFSKKRAKFLYFAFFMIGVVLAICVIGFSNYFIIDTSSLEVDKHFSVVSSELYSTREQMFQEYYKIMNKVDNMTAASNFYYNFEIKLNFSETINYTDKTTMISYKGSEELKLLAGKAPDKNEIVVSKKFADDFIKKYSLYFPNYESLIGLVDDNSYYKISGVVDNDFKLIYMNDESFLEYLNLETNTFDMTMRDFAIEKKYKTYEIIEGRDLTEEDYQDNVALISKSFRSYLGDTYYYKGQRYEIVGVFDFKDYPSGTDCNLIVHKPTYFPIGISATASYEYRDYKLVEGRAPSAPNEFIVPIYSNLTIGDKVLLSYSNTLFEVVGKYISDTHTMGMSSLFSRDIVMISNPEIYMTWFQSDPSNQIHLDEGLSIKNIFNYYYDVLYEEQVSFLLMFGILSLVLVITIAVLIYFIMRSRMISDIYPIGVYRSIGASRMRLILRFISDILVTVTLTSLLGYLFTTIIFDTIAWNINDSLSMNALKSSYLFSSLGVLLLYLLNLFFGLFPIIMLMRKTPAEIISKYDI